MWLGYLPKVMLAVVITLMDEAYFKIALWLNDKGNLKKVSTLGTFFVHYKLNIFTVS